MLQLRAMRREYRAAFAAACALMFSLLLSGAVRSAHAFADARGVACHHFADFTAAHPAAAQKESATQRDGAPARPGHRCPDCCLSAHAAPAVLPERLVSVTRPAAEQSATIHQSAAAARAPESFVSNGANGARAPPSI
ncbi:MAG: hypothetical protein FJX45_16835 [Alphaproteobacteria bacterium]|nr:hypothetical protein [Alphaproteobacteria bacterium]